MIPVSDPDLGEHELDEIRDAVESGHVSYGPKVLEFQDAYGAAFGYEHVVATNSCTAALDLAIDCLDLDGREILIPPITWISTAHVVAYNDYDLGWVDVEPATLNMSTSALADRISEETAAVIPVHYGGQAARIDELVEVAAAHDAAVIEDAAHCPGVEYRGEYVGSFGDVGCFSFQGTKVMTTGEGGVLVTDDPDLAATADRRVKLGLERSTYERSQADTDDWRYRIREVGYKYWMNDVQAGMGLAQLQRLPGMLERRRRVADRYRAAFEDLAWLSPLDRLEESTHAWYNYTVKVPADSRDDFVGHLRESGVGATVQYIPLYEHEAYADHDPTLPATESVWPKLVSLPMTSTLADEDVETVVDAVRSFEP